MIDPRRDDLTHTLILPTLLFAALGGMTWAVRGSSGYGGAAGCIFAGVMWGAAWWFMAREPSGERTRRYVSAWIVLAVTVGVGYSGARGWMQWPSFFEGKLQTDYAKGEFVPISRAYGFLWLFIAGVPWAGLGACLLAWCGSLRETRACHWMLRLGCGLGGAALARYLYDRYPQYFLPLYGSLEDRYLDLPPNPNLKRLINDSGNAIYHLGYYFGFLLYEVLRRDWKNVVLILTVGIVNGAGWAACQNWKWAAEVWPGANFNFWRCWESSGGISIGIAYGVAYFLVNRRMSDREQEQIRQRRSLSPASFEWVLVYCWLAAYLHLFLQTQILFPIWSHLYCAVALLFGMLYYHRQRGAADVAAILLVAAFIGGLFIGVREHFLTAWIYNVTVGLLGYGWLWFRGAGSTADAEMRRGTSDPNLEQIGLRYGLLLGLGLSIVNGLKGWFNIYLTAQTERFWLGVLWMIFGPVYLIVLILLTAWVLLRPLPRDFHGDRFPHAYGAIGLVLIVQNVLAQLITGPPSNWNEVVFNIYYLLLFFITWVIIHHYHFRQQCVPPHQNSFVTRAARQEAMP